MNPMDTLHEIILVCTMLLLALAGLALLACLPLRRVLRGDPHGFRMSSEPRGGCDDSPRLDPWREAGRRLRVDSAEPDSDDHGPAGTRLG